MEHSAAIPELVISWRRAWRSIHDRPRVSPSSLAKHCQCGRVSPCDHSRHATTLESADVGVVVATYAAADIRVLSGRQFQGSRVCSSRLLVRPETIRSKTSVR